VIEIIQSETFHHWLNKLKDRQIRARIHTRLDRMRHGNFGDVAPIGEGLSEIRIHYSSGYRVYFMQQEQQTIVLLNGGDKSTQNRDIKHAKIIARSWEEHIK
jgi:putative addiction module killer protein